MSATSGPPIAILGVPFDNVTTRQTVAIIGEMIASGRAHYLATANVDFTVQAMKDPELQRILLDAHLVVCDGMPLVWASRWLGNPLPERVAGSDLVPLLLRVAEEKGYRVFFLGGDEEVARTAVAKVGEKHPGLCISGHYSPPFAPLLKMDHADICRRIREAGTDLLFVSFGCPKQEKWIAMNYRKTGAAVSMGVGATIDFLAGQVKRAPRWMQATGLEWVYRLCQEPKRLFRRYMVDLRIFGVAILVQLWHLRRRPVGPSAGNVPPVPVPTPANEAGDGTVIELRGRVDAAVVREHQDEWLAATAAATAGLLVDCSAVEFLDSSGAGLLVRLQKTCRAVAHPLALVAPSPSVLKALNLMHLTSSFDLAGDVAEGRALLAKRFEEVRSPLAAGTEPGEVAWQGEVTASSTEALWQAASGVIETLEVGAALVISLAAVRFIDSTGACLMIRLKKLARRKDVRLVFRDPVEAVRAVIRLLKLEAYLLEP